PKRRHIVLEEELDPKNVRLTTQSEPKILMEVMPRGLVVSLLLLTYLVFAGGVTLIVRYNLRGTSTLVASAAPAGTTGLGALCAAGGGLSSSSLSSPSAAVTSGSGTTIASGGGTERAFVVGVDGPDPDSSSAAGCTTFSTGSLSELSLDAPTTSSSSSSFSLADDGTGAGGDGDGRYGAVFSGQFSGMTDLSGSVSLHVSVSDEEALSSLPDPAVVDLALEACTGEPMTAAAAAVGEGSGGESSSDSGSGAEEGEEAGEELVWGTCESGWQPVLFQEGISVRVRGLDKDQGYTLFNFYQNQETIRGQALVRQYRVQVGFVSTGTDSSSGSAGSTASESALGGLSDAKWSLEYETGATEPWARIVLACVLVLWVPVWLAWCWTVFYQKPQGGFK
ncbi:unnamed protein product, partial [Hapterophycus canaliculatus]